MVCADNILKEQLSSTICTWYSYFEFSMVLFLDSITECYCYEFKDWEIEAKEEVVRGLRI